MTPFGERLRLLRAARGMTQRQMARHLHLTPAYLSALEHGRRGRPAPGLVQQICGVLGIIWDEAEELQRLARLSHPRVVIETGGLAPGATEIANLLAERIADLAPATLDRLLEILRAQPSRRPRAGARPSVRTGGARSPRDGSAGPPARPRRAK